MTNDEKKIKHLEMIEKIIERMASNSFKLKGWAVTLVSIIGTIVSNAADKRFFWLVSVPIVAFWILDAFYLKTERKYKDLYREIAVSEKDVDFKMDTTELSMKENLKAFFKSFISCTESVFYGSIIAVTIVLFVVINCCLRS